MHKVVQQHLHACRTIPPVGAHAIHSKGRRERTKIQTQEVSTVQCPVVLLCLSRQQDARDSYHAHRLSLLSHAAFGGELAAAVPCISHLCGCFTRSARTPDPLAPQAPKNVARRGLAQPPLQASARVRHTFMHVSKHDSNGRLSWSMPACIITDL